ncbi:hypothetical protein [Streptomyces decoyicus]|uniref:hypothetical protein n=1 Tax=Streptomyces decoyicus TaxID=249567 RepID=UPI0033BB1830
MGAGMAGLTAASRLGTQGVAGRDRRDPPGRSDVRWGLCLSGPSLRALEELRLVGACLAAGYGMSVITLVDVDGGLADEVRLPRLIGAERPAIVGMARPALYRTLREQVDRCGVVVHHGLTIAAVDQEGEQVRHAPAGRAVGGCGRDPLVGKTSAGP